MYLNSVGGLDTLPVLVVVDLASEVSMSSSSRFEVLSVFLVSFGAGSPGCRNCLWWSAFLRKHLSQYLHFARSPFPDLPGSGVSVSVDFFELRVRFNGAGSSDTSS